MKYVKNLSEINKNNVDIAGGKGASLGELINAGVAVPPGFVLLSGAFKKFTNQSTIKSEIKKALDQTKIDDVNSIDKASNVLRDVIHDITIQPEIVDEILESHKQLNSSYVAVRSSATAEDSQLASWAGELETYLNTTEADLIENIKKCWSSLFTSRAIFYRHEKKLIDHDVEVAVVVQKMIQSEISGICFTVHPVTQDKNQMIIEASFGLGEAIVSGAITPDSYIIDKNNLEITNINIGQQNKKMVQENNKNVWLDLSAEESSKQKLNEDLTKEVAKTCQKVEDHYGFPCDIEWAIENGELYITQSRPITTLK